MLRNEFDIAPAVRRRLPLLLGFIGGTGSGKTLSALKVATGIAAGKKFAVIDTENGRALHYAPVEGAKADNVMTFDFDHLELHEPFAPDRYIAAIKACEKYPVVVIDSFSHEWAGDGGVLDMQEHALQRMAGDDYGKRESCKMASWVQPKMAHKKMVSHLLQVAPHVIICLRAEPKVEMKKNERGKFEVVEKSGPTGAHGWFPICDSRFPFELTTSLLLLADAPGVPHPIKLEAQHRVFVSLADPLTAAAGEGFAAWAEGGKSVALPYDARLLNAARALGWESWQIEATLDEHGRNTETTLKAMRAEYRKLHPKDEATV